MPLPSNIRLSTDDDLVRILRWSKTDEDDGHVSFFKNSYVLVTAHFRETLYVLHEDDGPIGFLANGVTAPDIMVIRASRRGLGYGKQLAQFMLDSWHQDQIWIYFEVAPEVLSFWEHMGCVAFELHDKCYVYHERSPRVLSYPEDAPPVQVDLSIFPKEAEWIKDIKPEYVLRPPAVRVEDRVQFARQVLFRRDDPNAKKIIEIKIEGHVLYRGVCTKVEEHGLKLDPSKFGVYIETIENAWTDEDVFEDSE